MTAEPDKLEMFRSGRPGHPVLPPAFASPADPQRLLSAVADALNQCERHGLVVDLEKDGVITTRGYVLPVGDSRLGSRWAARMRTPSGYIPEDEGRDED